MKLSVFLVLLFSLPAWAGPRVGNGGGVWLCRDRGSLEIKWMRLTDLFEAEVEFGYEVPGVPESSALEIYKAKLAFIRAQIPALHGLIARSGAADIWPNIRFTPKQGVLTVIDDGFYRVRPAEESCPDGYIYYGQLANYTEDGRILVGENLWRNPALSELDRGALLVHEVVYKSLRAAFNDRNSVRARQIVAILFSSLKPGKARAAIDGVLASAAPEGEESQVELFPLHIACSGQIADQRGGKTSLVLTKLGNEMRARIGDFEFYAEATNDDSAPKLMKIVDAASGSTSAIDSSAIRAAFSGKSEIALSVQNSRRGVSATLSCWAEARSD